MPKNKIKFWVRARVYNLLDIISGIIGLASFGLYDRSLATLYATYNLKKDIELRKKQKEQL